MRALRVVLSEALFACAITITVVVHVTFIPIARWLQPQRKETT